MEFSRRLLALMGKMNHDPSKDKAWLDERIKKQESGWADDFNQREREKENLKWELKSLWSGERSIAFPFERWKSSLQDNSQLAKEVATHAYQIAQRMVTDDFNVLPTGEPGTGKTSLALAIGDYVTKRTDKHVFFINTMELVSLFAERFDDHSVEWRLNELQALAKKAGVLILDDFGTEAGMKQNGYYKPVRKDMQEWLYQIANARYDSFENRHVGSTIITTNNNSADLMEMYNPKLISRLVTKRKQNTISFDGLDDMRG